ncbi:MAG: glycoside hydrolase family 15 protein [Xanthobacteraceae bacterium]
MTDHGLDLAVIGNGATAALVDPCARIVWWCFPRFDSNPAFSRLLAGAEEKGFCDIVLDGQVDLKSEYVRNTAIVTTLLTDRHGGAVRITDFAPRFRQFDRVYRPPQLMRIIEPAAGLPRITVRVRPTHGYGVPITQRAVGSHHIRYTGGDTALRLTTDVPLSYIDRETSFVLTRPMHMVLGSDTPFEGSLDSTCREFCERTRLYWLEWVRRLAISYDWQDQVIRAAITLKLSSFEDTGAIIAAHTTSIPEAPGTGRTWDYRYCWLRDSYFVVQALNRLGATHTMEEYIEYILSISSVSSDQLRPVYSVVSSDPLEERIEPNLAGYRGDGPVRVGNEAAVQDQHDAYGSIILATAPSFFDQRLPKMGGVELFHRLEAFGEKAASLALTPDAGIWEFRGRTRIHTHSSAMCWAGCQRLEAIAAHLGLPDRARYWGAIASKLGAELLERAWNPRRKAFTGAIGADELDASVLLLPELGLIEPNDPRFVSTVDAVMRELKRGHHVMRYVGHDDFGFPETAFLICRFWLVNALWMVGRKSEAHDHFVDALKLSNRYGLLSEDVHPTTNALWGNFPQTYSMAGLILAAMKLSRSWEDRYWRS